MTSNVVRCAYVHFLSIQSLLLYINITIEEMLENHSIFN
jgi:hypothetical protein